MTGSGGGRSLRLRLLSGAALLIVLALLGTGLALSAVFRDHVAAQYERELGDHLNQLAALLRLDPQGRPALEHDPSDPRFERPYGGRYWQVEVAGRPPPLRSPSLWDRSLPLAPDEPPPGVLHRHELEIPGIGRVLLLERLVRFAGPQDPPIRLAVALPAAEPAQVAADFDRMLGLALGLLALALLVGSALQVTVGLRPLRRLALAVGEVRDRAASRLSGDFPAEVAPLVDELNSVLGQREAMLARARAQAADLAHALKTSLQVLLLQADELESSGNEAGARLRRQVLRMQGVVEHQLARARAQSRPPTPAAAAPVAMSLDALLRVLSPLASQRGLVVEREVPAGHWFAGDAGDLEEMLGNLLDNACKWARTRVRVESRVAPGGGIVLRVEDDGPGLDARQREAAFERGRRLDERRPGSGFGLAIARELAEHHGGRATLARSPLGGLSAELELPGGDASNRSSPFVRQNAADRPPVSP